jgi:hypothetical protein
VFPANGTHPERQPSTGLSKVRLLSFAFFPLLEKSVESIPQQSKSTIMQSNVRPTTFFVDLP